VNDWKWIAIYEPGDELLVVPCWDLLPVNCNAALKALEWLGEALGDSDPVLPLALDDWLLLTFYTRHQHHHRNLITHSTISQFTKITVRREQRTVLKATGKSYVKSFESIPSTDNTEHKMYVNYGQFNQTCARAGIPDRLQTSPGLEIKSGTWMTQKWLGRATSVQGDIQSSKFQIIEFTQQVHWSMPRLMTKMTDFILIFSHLIVLPKTHALGKQWWKSSWFSHKMGRERPQILQENRPRQAWLKTNSQWPYKTGR